MHTTTSRLHDLSDKVLFFHEVEVHISAKVEAKFFLLTFSAVDSYDFKAL